MCPPKLGKIQGVEQAPHLEPHTHIFAPHICATPNNQPHGTSSITIQTNHARHVESLCNHVSSSWIHSIRHRDFCKVPFSPCKRLCHLCVFLFIFWLLLCKRIWMMFISSYFFACSWKSGWFIHNILTLPVHFHAPWVNQHPCCYHGKIPKIHLKNF